MVVVVTNGSPSLLPKKLFINYYMIKLNNLSPKFDRECRSRSDSFINLIKSHTVMLYKKFQDYGLFSSLRGFKVFNTLGHP